MEKVEQKLEILDDSPQVIVVMAAAIIMLTASVINLLIGIQNMKMAKALKDDNKENKKEILKEFVENWSKAENLIRGQPRQETMPISREVAVPSPLLQVTVRGQGH